MSTATAAVGFLPLHDVGELLRAPLRSAWPAVVVLARTLAVLAGSLALAAALWLVLAGPGFLTDQPAPVRARVALRH